MSSSVRTASDEVCEGALEARARLRAVHCCLRLTLGEEDHGREGEDPVARGEPGILVDVHPNEPDAFTPLVGESDEVRLDRVARSAPRRPEVDDHRHRRPEDVLLEPCPSHQVHGYSLPVSARSRSSGTFSIASVTIEPVILDAPARRSTNVIGTSRTRRPARAIRYVVSIWKA